jgi:hypothetical protein
VRSLQLRNVPEDVIAGLERLAEKAGVSVNAFAIGELSQVARRVDNAAILATLPDVGVDIGKLIVHLDAERGDR